MIDIQGLTAPFLLTWLPYWVFAFLGGLAAAFVRIDDIDRRLVAPFIAKPLTGMTAGLAIVTYLNGNAEPPSVTLTLWAFLGAVLSTPILTGFLVFISDQKRQQDFYDKAKDKFLPWTKKGDKS